MAPRKPTAKQEDNPNELILHYLRTQNRPYSTTEISSNLHNKVTKAKADKILKELADKKEVSAKTSGKSTVYWCLQDPKDAATPAELAAFDTAIVTLRESLPGLKTELKMRTQTLATLRSQPTTAGLKESIELLQKERDETQIRLEVLRGGSVKPVSAEERARTEGEWRAWTKKRDARKKAFRELEGAILEMGGMGREELWEKAGIDDDP